MAPGPRFSMTTSASRASRVNISRPLSLLRLRFTPFLFAFRSRKNHESLSGRSDRPRRAGSPVGGSILITSAPSQASSSVQLGPAAYCVRSRTRMPSSALSLWAKPLGAIRGEPHRLRPRLGIGDDVDHRRLAGSPGPLEGRTDLVRLVDELAVGAELLRDPVIAREAQVAARLLPRGIGRPATVVADDDHDGNPVTDRRVHLHRVEP